mgnify:CR=1 FL=1
MHKCIVLVRTDLKMTKGKIISQVSHGIINNSFKVNKNKLINWRENGEKIVTLKINNYQNMLNIYNKAINNNIISHIVIDQGLTQVDTNTPTVCVLGPDKEKKFKDITSHLKLY